MPKMRMQMTVNALRKQNGPYPADIAKLQRNLFFGIPRNSPPRSDPREPSNAMLLYWHEYGTISEPARPSVEPGIANVRPEIVRRLARAFRAEVKGQRGAMDRAWHACGKLGVAEIQSIIRASIPPPISDNTKRWRLQRRPAYQAATPETRRRMMAQWMDQTFIPLIDTEQMINAITYILRKR